ncbi:hypothetical protein RSAG8_08516, partial [Rhizoctonia solani AG-8 WAC10335]
MYSTWELEAAHYGFPSVHPDAVSEDLTRIDTDRVPEEALAILDYFYKKGPAGARVKTSKVKKPDPAQGKAAVDDDNHETDSVSNADADAWTEEDEEWVQRFVNRKFALYLWTTFPGRRSQVSHRLLEQPFTNNMWGDFAQPGIQKQPLVRGVNAFASKVQEFFPRNWVTTRKHSVWQAYQTGVLNALRERTRAQAQGNLNSYNTKMREAIIRQLGNWHFLPCPQTKLIWSYEGSGKDRIYRVVANPNVVSKETL